MLTPQKKNTIKWGTEKNIQKNTIKQKKTEMPMIVKKKAINNPNGSSSI